MSKFKRKLFTFVVALAMVLSQLPMCEASAMSGGDSSKNSDEFVEVRLTAESPQLRFVKGKTYILSYQTKETGWRVFELSYNTVSEGIQTAEIGTDNDYLTLEDYPSDTPDIVSVKLVCKSCDIGSITVRFVNDVTHKVQEHSFEATVVEPQSVNQQDVYNDENIADDENGSNTPPRADSKP